MDCDVFQLLNQEYAKKILEKKIKNFQEILKSFSGGKCCIYNSLTNCSLVLVYLKFGSYKYPGYLKVTSNLQIVTH